MYDLLHLFVIMSLIAENLLHNGQQQTQNLTNSTKHIVYVNK